MDGIDGGRRAALFGLAAAPLAAIPARAAAAGTGAGAFVRPPLFVIEEYHLVVDGQQQTVIDYYRRMALPVLRSYPGYMGFSVLDPRPAASAFKSPAVAPVVGIPASPIQPHEGIMMDGKVRTDRQVLFHTALNGAFNLIFHHHLADEPTFRALIGHTEAGASAADSLANRWKSIHGTDIWDEMARDYFVHMKNHYDVVYSYRLTE